MNFKPMTRLILPSIHFKVDNRLFVRSTSTSPDSASARIIASGSNGAQFFKYAYHLTQGEHVGYLWQHLFEDGIKINFAHRSFKWFNEIPNREFLAHVHCVVISFARFNRDQKWIFSMALRKFWRKISMDIFSMLRISVLNCIEIHCAKCLE